MHDPDEKHDAFHANTPRVAQPLPVAHEDLEHLANFAPLNKARNTVRFADVGGMDALKKVAQMKIVQPFAHPELFKKYGKTAGGGILLYGPPGCGKTYFAKAIAGECDAAFFNVGIHDILNLYVGNSERNVQRLFATARAQRPAILFIDELDALGRKRDLMRHSNLTSTINAFLAELDGAVSDNDNLLVIGATNAPWDIDSAFKRPGRFDQLLFVPPPDTTARQAILDLHLANRPCAADLDTARLSQDTEQFSGADLAALVDEATGRVLTEVLGGGAERPITQADLQAARKPMKASTQEWLATARNYVEYANEGGDYGDVAQYLDGAGRSKRGKFGFF
jgi:SpoVK/Ycf46/Vps4 family AAA+-type ATPase